MRWTDWLLGCSLLLALALTGCGPTGATAVITSATEEPGSQPTTAPTATEEPVVEPTALPTATEEPVVAPTVAPLASEEPEGESTPVAKAVGAHSAESAAAWELSEGRWETYTTQHGLPSSRIAAMAVDPDGYLWVGAERVIGRFDGDTWETIVDYSEKEAYPDDRFGRTPSEVHNIIVDDQGRPWLSIGPDVYLYDQGTLTLYYTPDAALFFSNHTFVEDILQDSQDRVWLAGHWCSGQIELESGLTLLDGNETRYFGFGVGLSDYMNNVVEDATGVIWAVGDGGVLQFEDGETWEFMTQPEQLVGQTINQIVVDSSGRLWLGTHRLGLWIWDGEAAIQYMPEDGLAGYIVSDIAFDGVGRAWLGTNGGVSVFDGETWTTYTAEDGLADNAVYILALARDGVWISTRRGLSHLLFERFSD